MRRYHFDLDRAIAAWRRSLTTTRAITADDLDELEQHVRDQVTALMAEGADEATAFRQAMREMGDYATAESEYRKVYLGKLHHWRGLTAELSWRVSMLGNYLKLAYRTLRRHKVAAILNLLGLALGLAVCMVAAQYIRDEYRFDTFHAGADRIHQVIYYISDAVRNGRGDRHLSITQPRLAPDLTAAYPEVARTVRLHPSTHVVSLDVHAFSERLLFADPDFFSMFSFPLVHGDPETALRDKNALVLTDRAARKYFGDQNPVGRVMQVKFGDAVEEVQVSGVAQNPPANSTIQFDFVLPYEQLVATGEAFRYESDGLVVYTFVELKEGASAAALEAKLPALVATHHGEWMQAQRHDQDDVRYWLLALTDLHLNTQVESGESIPLLGVPSNPPVYSYILLCVAAVVLAIACINFMTISIGHAVFRAREVGVRRVLGAGRGQVMKQFWVEAWLLTLLALLIALPLIQFSLPVFNALSGKSLTLRFWIQPAGLLMLAGLWLLVGFLAGLYPSLLLGRFEPIEALKNRVSLGGQRSWGKAFVCLQFACTMVLAICALVISKQMAFIQQHKTNPQGSQFLILRNEGDARLTSAQAYAVLKNTLSSHSSLELTAAAQTLGEAYWRGTYEPEQGDGAFNTEDDLWVPQFLVDDTYLDVYGHRLLAGRTFSRDRNDAGRSILVNEAFVRALGLEHPVGARVRAPASDWFPDEMAEIIGVVEDFHFESLHHAIRPAAFVLLETSSHATPRYVSVRFHADDLDEVLALTRTAWHAVYPDLPFDYSFFDERFEQFYRSERQWRQIVGYASALGLLIACLGVFGLSMLAAANRTKEIGIRKVLGARVAGIVLLFYREFFKPVAIAFLVAAPVAYVVMSRWLQGFAYRTEITADVFLTAGTGVLLLVLITASYHAVRTATAPPIEALRYE